MAWRSVSTYILIVLLDPLGVELIVPESTLARVSLVFLATVDAARRMRTRLPRRGSLGRVLQVTTPSQTTMHVLLIRTSAMSALAELSSASSGRMTEIPTALADQDSGTGGGRIDGTMPTYNGKRPPYKAFGSTSSPGVSNVEVHCT